MTWTKYKAKKTEVDGITFASKKEARRYEELKLLERAGEISNLRKQVKYELIPPCRRDDGLSERACTYIADFVYDDNDNEIVEDVKGYKTKEYRIKRKLMLWVHGITIKEI